MAIAFPSAPIVNQVYTYAGRAWVWNGQSWNLIGSS